MCIRELIDQFEIQGAYRIKVWNDDKFDCITLASGSDFECDKWNIAEDILERKITYMYVTNNELNVEVELEEY